jgi:hypothetical protein
MLFGYIQHPAAGLQFNKHEKFKKPGSTVNFFWDCGIHF